jgi:hypothetical protein
MSDAKERILQLLPAEGWEAMFEDEDNVTVVCFALVESTDEEGAVSSAVRPMASIGDRHRVLRRLPQLRRPVPRR